MTSGGNEILDYNALKTSEFQNSLFITYNMTIKKTFYNTTDLTFHSNKTISSHIKSQNIITQVPKFWPSREHWKTHNQHMHFSLPTTQIFIFKRPWPGWWLSSGMWHFGIPVLNWSMVNVSQSIKHSTVLMRSFMVDKVGSLMFATRETMESYLHVMQQKWPPHDPTPV